MYTYKYIYIYIYIYAHTQIYIYVPEFAQEPLVWQLTHQNATAAIPTEHSCEQRAMHVYCLRVIIISISISINITISMIIIIIIFIIITIKLAVKTPLS